ncbi:hypothetical protein EDC01DRAFT_670431 [Geopyxis carbonaria]|nr:hypothetical protein EDC01DRAFT_670431 [Geopyxis carbonaria]
MMLGSNHLILPPDVSFREDHDNAAECFAVLDINNNNTHVQYYPFKASEPQPIPDVQDFYLIPDCTAKLATSDEIYDGCMKSALKNQKTLSKMLGFLSGTPHEDVSVETGPVAFTERMEIKSKDDAKILHSNGKPMINMNQFSKASFTFRHHVAGTLISDTQFFSTRGSNLRAKDKITDFGQVHIVSGICLLSQNHLGYKHGQAPCAGKFPVENHLPLPEDRRPTMYELESVTRLSNSIADAIMVISSDVDINVTLDIPQVQYYASVVELFESGLCSKEHLTSWFDIFGQRHDQLATIFCEALKAACSRRGCYRPRLQIEVSTGLQEAIPYIQRQVHNNENLDMKVLLEELSAGDEDWTEYIACVSDSQKVLSNLTALSRASYSYQLLKPIIRRHRELNIGTVGGIEKEQKRQVLLHIDNQAEWRIYSEAESVLKTYYQKLDQSRGVATKALLLGLYPLERVFTGASTGRTSLYLNDGGQDLQEKQTGLVLGPGAVLSRVYGADMVGDAMRLSSQAGMFHQSNSPVSSTPSLTNDSETWSTEGGSGCSTPLHGFVMVSELELKPSIMDKLLNELKGEVFHSR